MRQVLPVSHRWPLLLPAVVLCGILGTAEAELACQDLLQGLYTNCSSFTSGKNSDNPEITAGCCTLNTRSNKAHCHCNVPSFGPDEAARLKLISISKTLYRICNPTLGVNAVNITSCGPPTALSPTSWSAPTTAQCTELMTGIFESCGNNIQTPATAPTRDIVECCRLSREANEARCYCDPSLITIAESIGITTVSLESIFVIFCAIPTKDVNLFSTNGCDSNTTTLETVPGPSGGTSSGLGAATLRRGVLSAGVSIAIWALTSTLLG